MLWVISIDALYCNIYQIEKHQKIKLYKQLKHLQSKMKNHELSSDKAGKYGRFSFFSHSGHTPRTAPKENEKLQFANEVANELNLAREKNLYQSLIIAGEPKMRGLLNTKLNANVKSILKKEFNSNFNNLNMEEIIDKIKPWPIEK